MEQKMINGVYCQNMPCCGIFAAALASGKEPQEVFDAYKAKFKKTGRWKGSTTTKGLKELMRNQLGVKFVEIPDLKWMTVRQFAVNYTKRSGTYLVWVRGHVMTISKGRLIDQWHCQPIETAKKNRCKIVSVVEIVNAPDIPEGQISGNATKEQLAEAQQKRDAEKLEADKAKLWKGCCKFGLDSKKIGEFENSIEISIDFEDLESKKEQAIAKISGSLKVKGFRPGKIPKNIVTREVGEDYILEEAVDLYLPEQIFDILQKEEINPAVRPVVKELKKEKKSFKVDVLITLWPTLLKLPKLNQTVEVESITPTEDEINEQIERIKLQFGEVEKVERPSKASDYLLVNISSLENGTEVKEFNYQDYLYELGSNLLTPSMDSKLEGVSSGAIIKFNDDIPALGKTNVEITVLVKEIKQKVMPELTDEWVSSVTEFDTVKEMNEELVKNIEDAKKRQVANQYQGLLTSKIIDESKLELPEQLVIAEMDSILQNFMNELKQNNIKIEDYLKITGLTEETLQDDLKNQATRNLSMVVILDKVVEQEDLKLDEIDIKYIDEHMGTHDEGDQAEGASHRINLESESLRNKAMVHILKQGVSVDSNGEKVYLQDVYNQVEELREEE